MINKIIILLLILLEFNCTTTNSSADTNSSSELNNENNSFKTKALEKAHDENNLVLKEFAMANLDLSDLNISFNETYLEQAFKDFAIKIDKFDTYTEYGPTYLYSAMFSSSNNKSQVFIIDISKDNVFNGITISSPLIMDQYGVTVSMSFDEVKLLRPNFVIGKDVSSFDQPTLEFKNSNISYLLCCPKEIKDVYTLDDLKDLTIQAVLWKPSKMPFE